LFVSNWSRKRVRLVRSHVRHKVLSLQSVIKLITVLIQYIALIIILCISTAYLASCQSSRCKNFFDLPKEQRDAEFKSYALDKQLEIYHCAMSQQPQELDYAYFIADGGEKNISTLLQKLKSERSEVDKLEIIYLFRAMSVRGQLRHKQEVINQLEKAVADFSIRPLKEQAMRDLEVIRNNSE
jgi:hypothetical protein